MRVTASGSSRPPGRSRPSADERRRDLRRRRRNALLILVGGLAVVVAFVVWASRDGGSSGGESEVAAEQAPLGVVARSPQPQLPAPRTTAVAVTATGGQGMEMRVVATPKGAPAVSGPWQPVAKQAQVPTNIRTMLEAGSIPGHVEVRDDAGRTARSTTLLLPPTPGSGTAEIVRSVTTTKPYVALVFDDGLDEAGVKRIIEVLRRTKSGGTFCFNGVNVKTWPASLAKTVQAAVADGIITMCSHGWGHRTSTTSSESEATSDLSNNATTDRYVGVSSVPFYRPPYGALSPGIEQAAGKLGYRWIVMWDVDPSDYEKPDPATLTQRVVSESGKGSIVVLHAIATTADALPGMIKGLNAKGLKAVTLTKMFGETMGSAAAGSASTTGTTPTVPDTPTTPSEGA